MANSEIGSNIEDDVHGDDGGVWTTQTRRKRNRRSTSGTFSENISKETICRISKESFKNMPTDDKLVSLFEVMTSGFGSVNSRVQDVEDNVHELMSSSAQVERRLKLVEYRSLDQEARSRRNNLIFRGHLEIVGHDDCVGVINRFLAEKFEMHNVNIQRAHRLGSLRNIGRRSRSRPIIVCFGDFRDVQNIMAKAHTLRGTDYGINRDYPDEIVQARSRLWSDYKQAKPNYSKGKVYIAFPAKLVINGEVTRDEFPDWKDILKGSRVEHKAKHPDSKAGYSGRGRGRERGGGRGRGRRRERSQHGPRGSRDQVRDRGPGASAGSDVGENEIEMGSTGSRSDDENGLFESPNRSPGAAQSFRSPRGGGGSVSSTENIDGYSQAMLRLETTSGRIGQSAQQGTYTTTLTVKSPTKQGSASNNA